MEFPCISNRQKLFVTVEGREAYLWADQAGSLRRASRVPLDRGHLASHTKIIHAVAQISGTAPVVPSCQL
jgi:hypothetical protein